MNEFCSLCALKDHIEESLKKSGDAISAASFVENLTSILSLFLLHIILHFKFELMVVFVLLSFIST